MNNLRKVCISEGMCFMKRILGTNYCNLGNSKDNIDCMYFGKRDKNDLHICNYNEAEEWGIKRVDSEIIDLN